MNIYDKRYPSEPTGQNAMADRWKNSSHITFSWEKYFYIFQRATGIKSVWEPLLCHLLIIFSTELTVSRIRVKIFSCIFLCINIAPTIARRSGQPWQQRLRPLQRFRTPEAGSAHHRPDWVPRTTELSVVYKVVELPRVH